MIHDSNPSILFLGYSRPKKKKEVIEAMEKKGLGVREVYFLDVSIPMNKDYDKIINWFKHFIMCDYWSGRNPMNINFPMKDMIMKKLMSSMNYKSITFKSGDWKNDNRHKLLYSLLCPLVYQDTSRNAETKTEKENFEKLKTFSSEGYKPKITGVLKDKDMEMLV